MASSTCRASLQKKHPDVGSPSVSNTEPQPLPKIMKALQFTGRTKKLELVEVPVPQVTEPNHVLLKIAYAGVCGTDLHVMSGEFPGNPDTKIYGHESVGVVLQIGPAVQHVKTGDRVAIDPNEGCGYCDFCHDGKIHYCPTKGCYSSIGFWRDGGWAEYCLVPAHALTKLPDSLTLEQAVISEPMSCLSHGWDMIQPVPIGSRILILGAGIIGNLWTSTFHLHGHKKVTVCEQHEPRLEITKRLDTGYTLLTPDQLKQEQTKDPNYLFDVIVDCSGSCEAMENALTMMDMGGVFCIFGCAPHDGFMKVSPFQLYRKEIKILAVFINPFSFPKAQGMMEAMGSRYLDYEKLGIKVFKLTEYQQAFEELKSKNISKAVFKPS